MFNKTSLRTLVGAVWFASGGGLLALLAALIFTFYPEPTTYTLVRSVVLAALITGAAGMAPGTLILNPRRVRSGLIAALLGACVGAASFVLSFISLLALSYLNMEYPSLGGFVYSLMLGTVSLSVMFGWAAALVGGFVGWLLFYLRRPISDKLRLA